MLDPISNELLTNCMQIAMLTMEKRNNDTVKAKELLREIAAEQNIPQESNIYSWADLCIDFIAERKGVKSNGNN